MLDRYEADQAAKRIATEYQTTAWLAYDTAEPLIRRVKNLVSHGRRMARVIRAGNRYNPLQVVAGLTVSSVSAEFTEERAGVWVHVDQSPRIGFGFQVYPAADGLFNERNVRSKIAGCPFEEYENVTEVRIVGGLNADDVFDDDKVVIREWGHTGDLVEYTIVFDNGKNAA